MPDPIPHPRGRELERAATQWAHYRRSMMWLALTAAVTAALSIRHLLSGDGAMAPGLAIALTAGIGLAVLTATAIRLLVFLAHRRQAETREGGRP